MPSRKTASFRLALTVWKTWNQDMRYKKNSVIQGERPFFPVIAVWSPARKAYLSSARTANLTLKQEKAFRTLGTQYSICPRFCFFFCCVFLSSHPHARSFQSTVRKRPLWVRCKIRCSFITQIIMWAWTTRVWTNFITYYSDKIQSSAYSIS